MEFDIDIDEPVEDAPPREVPADALVQPGTTIGGRFQVRSLVGRGLLGEVYRATDTKSERTVALRLLPSDLLGADLIARLRGDVQTAATLKHKNVAATFGMGEAGGLTFVTSEYVDGQSLRALVAHKGSVGKAFSLKGAYNVAAHTCNALAIVHESMVHGVLGPGNVLINKAGRVKLTDFGFTHVLRDLAPFRERRAAGELYYVAPEVVSSKEVDPRADIFSVGAILYELLTGQAPAEGGPPPSKLRPDLPRALDEVVARCLQPRPEDRFADAPALKTALLAAVEGKATAPATAAKASATAAPAAKRAPFGAGLPVGTQPGLGSAPGAAPIPLGTIPGVGPSTPSPRPAPVATQPGVSAPSAPRPEGLPEPPKPADVVDENEERWLVQKDRLDFGPYSLHEVRRRIEDAEFLGDHFIVDQQTGMRRRIRDLPALRDFVREGEVRREQIRREAADHEHHKQERRRFGLLALLVLGVLIVTGGIVTYVVVYRSSPVITTQIAIKDKGDGLDRDLQKLIAGIQISSSVETGRKRRRVRRGAGRPGAEGPDVTYLGDVTKEGGDEQISADEINGVMRSNFRGLAACMLDARRRDPGLHKVVISFDVHGDGHARNVRVNGSSGDALTACISGRMSGFRFPRYTGPKTKARWDMRMQ